jgi:membrane fusion protein (multidrug efflux system)
MASPCRFAVWLAVKWLIPVVCLAIQPVVAFAQEQPAPAVTVAPAEMSDLRPSLAFSGRAAAVQKVEIRARVTGFLEAIHFTEGKPVKQGNVLFEIEDDAFKAAVTEVEGLLAVAEAEQKYSEIDYIRKEKLAKKGAVAQQDFDVAVANIGKVKGEMKRLQGVLDRAKLDLSYTRITSPFDGIAGLSAVDVGGLVGPETGALTTITRLDPMAVEFQVATADVVRLRQRRLQEGGPRASEGIVSLTLADGSLYPHKGRVNFVDAFASKGTDTVTLRAEFENPDGLLLDGALVDVALEQVEPALVLSVPQRAVQIDQLGSFVMVVIADSTVELRRVTVDRVTNGRSVISKGLEEGELVITDGLNKVRPGIAVDAATASGS